MVLPDFFWANVDLMAADLNWAATMSEKLGGTRKGLPAELTRGMATSNNARVQVFDVLIQKSFAVKAGDDLSPEVRFRRLTELDVVGDLLWCTL